MKLETVYFAIVNVTNPLTGECIFDNQHMILSEDQYYKYSSNDEDDDIFIEWCEEWEVVRFSDNKYLLVNYYEMDETTYNENVFEIFQTEIVGGIEIFKGQTTSLEDLITWNTIG